MRKEDILIFEAYTKYLEEDFNLNEYYYICGEDTRGQNVDTSDGIVMASDTKDAASKVLNNYISQLGALGSIDSFMKEFDNNYQEIDGIGKYADEYGLYCYVAPNENSEAVTAACERDSNNA